MPSAVGKSDSSVSKGPLVVSLFMRKPVPGEHFSIERLFSTLAAEMPRDRIDVRVKVCPYESKGLVRRVALMFWAARNQADINHVTGDVHFLTLFLKRSRTILTIHDIAAMRRLRGVKSRLFRLFWLKLPIKRSARVTTVSEATKSELALHLGTNARAALVIPNCVPAGISLVPKPFVKNCPRILQIGTAPHKNLTNVIRAVAGLDCVLVVIGRVSIDDEDLGRRLGVCIENHVSVPSERVRELLEGCDLVVFVSTHEGFGMPILEAQAVGRPLITSAREPMESVAGRGAVLVEPEDSSSIREAILQVIHGDGMRDQLVSDGYRNASQYTAKEIAERYVMLYEALHGPCSE